MKTIKSNRNQSSKTSKLSLLDIAKRLENRELFPEKKERGIKALQALNI
jgi:hypothetical protein